MSGNNHKLENIKDPHKVKILILSQSKTNLKEFYIVKTFGNLIKIDLSYNKLISFPPGFSFGSFKQLRVVFLHYNKFSSLKNLITVSQSKTINYLTLFGNPLQQAKTRHFFINQMPSLMLMDDKIVKQEERNLQLHIQINDRPILPFPLFNEEENQQNFILNVVKQLYFVRKQYLKANPLILIQRWWKQYYRRISNTWKSIILPKNIEEIQTISNIKQHKHDLSRLTTEKLQPHRLSEEIVTSLMQKNHYFWQSFRDLISRGKVYIKKEFCEANSIPYMQNKAFMVLRQVNFRDFNLKRKRCLQFFIKYHSFFVFRTYIRSFPDSIVSIKEEIQRKYLIYGQRFKEIQREIKERQREYCTYVIPDIPQEEIIKIIKKLYYNYFNAKNTSFPFIFQPLIQRCLAASTIQRMWRGSKVRQNTNASKMLRQKRSAIRIQRWLRNIRFIHRHKFLLQVSHYLRRQSLSNEICLEMKQVEAIESYCIHMHNCSTHFSIPFQLNKFIIIKNTNKHHHQESSIVFFSERKPYPAYLPLTFQNHQILQQNKDDKSKIQTQNNVLQIIFKDAIAIHRLIDHKGMQYIKVRYHNIAETLNRKFILALKTYRMMNYKYIQSIHVVNIPENNRIDLVQQINQNKLISIVYEGNKNAQEGVSLEHFKELENKKQQASINSEISLIGETICFKVKFYMAKIDKSCLLFVKSLDYMKINETHEQKDNTKSNAYFLKKALSKRYDNLDQRQLTQHKSKSIISRTVLNLQQLSQQNSYLYKQNLRYPKIMNTDQSHSIFQSIEPNQDKKNLKSLNQSEIQKEDQRYHGHRSSATVSIRDQHRYRRHIEQILQLKHKRQKIEEIKSSHREKITQIVTQKVDQLIIMRRSMEKEHTQLNKKIEEIKQEADEEKMKKHNQIKQYFKSQKTTFEREFMKKGIKIINKELHKFQKRNRSLKESTVHVDNKPIQENKRYPFKKQLKQFSMNVNEISGQGLQQLSSSQKAREKLKKDVELYSNSRQKSLASLNSQLLNANIQSKMITKKQQSEEEKKMRNEHKKMKKKRLIHSVFPEQFYPLKQANQIGFQLPKIAKR